VAPVCRSWPDRDVPVVFESQPVKVDAPGGEVCAAVASIARRLGRFVDVELVQAAVTVRGRCLMHANCVAWEPTEAAVRLRYGFV
jgi:hypothetical protein